MQRAEDVTVLWLDKGASTQILRDPMGSAHRVKITYRRARACTRLPEIGGADWSFGLVRPSILLASMLLSAVYRTGQLAAERQQSVRMRLLCRTCKLRVC